VAADISDDVAGATVLALATGGFEVLFSAVETLEGQVGVGLDFVLGTGVVNFGLILPVVCAASTEHPIELHLGSVVRDGGFALAAFLALLIVVNDGQVTLVESASLLALYACHVSVCFLSPAISLLFCASSSSSEKNKDDEDSSSLITMTSASKDHDENNHDDKGNNNRRRLLDASIMVNNDAEDQIGGVRMTKSKTTVSDDLEDHKREEEEEEEENLLMKKDSILTTSATPSTPTRRRRSCSFLFQRCLSKYLGRPSTVTTLTTTRVRCFGHVVARLKRLAAAVAEDPCTRRLLRYSRALFPPAPRVITPSKNELKLPPRAAKLKAIGATFRAVLPTLLGSGLWLVFILVILTRLADLLALSARLPLGFAASVFLPAIYALPDVLVAATVARRGQARAAVANALGVQVVTVLLGVGLPFALANLRARGEPVTVLGSDSDAALRWSVFGLGVLFVCLVLAPVLRGLRADRLPNPHFSRKAAMTLLLAYLAVTAMVTLRTAG